MSLQADITALEEELKTAGVALDAFLTAASVDRSTWTRWKNGSVKGARYDTIERVRSAAREAIEAAPANSDRRPHESGAAA